MDCLICLNKVHKNYNMLQCGHRFHSKCIQQWEHMLIYQGKPITCPYCRNKYDNIAYNIRNNIRFRNNKLITELHERIYDITFMPIFINDKLDYTPKINKIIELFEMINRNSIFFKKYNDLKVAIQRKAFEFIDSIHRIRQLNWNLKTKVTGILHKTLSLYS